MPYTCTDYRSEMVLLGLRRQLADENLSDPEREALETQVRQLEVRMGIEEP
jgi:hypothetical protein